MLPKFHTIIQKQERLNGDLFVMKVWIKRLHKLCVSNQDSKPTKIFGKNKSVQIKKVTRNFGLEEQFAKEMKTVYHNADFLMDGNKIKLSVIA